MPLIIHSSYLRERPIIHNSHTYKQLPMPPLMTSHKQLLYHKLAVSTFGLQQLRN
ncbi:hypothetical protein BGX38DRAFT_573540 [Terfezia claveryi]|nr:hypothetical protein BGX38DRAFT_573540 [Terfezia claveryi]